MKWSTSYAIGVESIDAQHQGIFEMSEDLRAALDEGRGERVFGLVVESLHAYAGLHFGFEEACMTKCHCPAAQENAQAHAAFIDALARVQQRYDAKGFDRADAQHLVDFVDKWLTEHIIRVDVQLKPYAAKL